MLDADRVARRPSWGHRPLSTHALIVSCVTGGAKSMYNIVRLVLIY